MEAKPAAWTTLTAGAARVTIAKNARNPRVTSREMSLAMTIWMIMVNGVVCRTTGPSGFPLALLLGGRRTASDIGPGSHPGVGPGSKTSPGVLPHFTTGVGP